MKKILIEIIAFVLVLAIAVPLIFLLFTQNVEHDDTYTGNISKAPINITSPVYGQILTLPVHEGDRVRQGQTLATIHILNPNTLPTDSPLYHIKGMQLSVQSPTAGVVGQIAFAPFSTVAGAGSLMYLYSANSLEVQILLPQGHAVSDYSAFYAQRPPDAHRYALHIIGQVPTNVISNIDPTTSVYRATCTNCQGILDNESVAIQAQRKQPPSPILDYMHSLLNHIHL